MFSKLFETAVVFLPLFVPLILIFVPTPFFPHKYLSTILTIGPIFLTVVLLRIFPPKNCITLIILAVELPGLVIFFYGDSFYREFAT